MLLMLPCKCSWPLALEMTLQELSDYSSGTTLHVSALCLPHVTACDQISQAFPLCNGILQELDQRLEVGTPGNEARRERQTAITQEQMHKTNCLTLLVHGGWSRLA